MPKKGPRYGTALSTINLKLTRGDRAGFRREAEAGLKLVRRWWLCIIEGPLGCPRAALRDPPTTPRISLALSPLLRSPGCERRTGACTVLCQLLRGPLLRHPDVFQVRRRQKKRCEKKTSCHGRTHAPIPSALLLALSSQALLSAAAWVPSPPPARRPRSDACFHSSIFSFLLANFFFPLLSILKDIHRSD